MALKLRKNIETVFSKFAHEGKATIRFKQPPLDVCISKVSFYFALQADYRQQFSGAEIARRVLSDWLAGHGTDVPTNH